MKLTRLKEIVDYISEISDPDCEVFIQIEDANGDPDFECKLDDVMNTCRSEGDTRVIMLTLIGVNG